MPKTPCVSYQLQDQSFHVIDIKQLHGAMFSDITKRGIQKTLNQGQSVIVFINKRGVHTGMVCKECGHIPYCNNCDIPIGLFNNSHQQLFGLCPVCQEVYQTIITCPHCGHNKLEAYGIGIQQAEQYCKETYKRPVICVQSSTANTHKKIEIIFEQSKNKSCIILATSILQYPITKNIGMVVFQNALQSSIPDYNSELQNYLFLYNTINSYQSKHFIIQTYQPQHVIIQSLVTNNKETFFIQDRSFRQKHNYPPFGELCILSYKHPVEKSLFSQVNKLFNDILMLKQKEGYSQIEVFAIPAMIYRVYGKYRYQIIIKGPSIRQFTDIVFSKLKPFAKGFKFDRGAQSFF